MVSDCKKCITFVCNNDSKEPLLPSMNNYKTDKSNINKDLLPLFNEPAAAPGPLVIAGPCSAERRDQVLATASQLKENGITHFRAGLWKPRTRPGAFEGVGARGLVWLKEVKEQLGMKVITEVGSAAHVAGVVGNGFDGVWIGARTVANPFAVQEIAEELKRLDSTDLTVLVKNPVNPDLELWIGAIERLHNAGIKRLGAVHRGFSSYSPGHYRNPPQWAIPIELHHRMPLLPLLHDPSHCCGKADMVPKLAKQAMKLCFSGLMIESHIAPTEALSDAAQQITPQQVGELVASLPKKCKTGSAADSLKDLRDMIDALDDELLQILSKRMEICREIGLYKNENDLPVVQPQRYAALLENKIAEGETLGLDPEFLYKLFTEIHAASVMLQLNMRADSR